MIRYYSKADGKSYSQDQINSRRSKVYRELYEADPHPRCAGCGKAAEGTSHIVPQKRCKDLQKPELIWYKLNLLPACHKCNSVIESYKSEEFQKLLCKDQVLLVTKMFDQERWSLMI